MKHPIALVILGLIGCGLSYMLGIATVHLDPAPNTVCSFADHNKLPKCVAVTDDTLHRCPFKLCPFQNKSGYIEHDGCTKGDECYIMDSLHLLHPSMSYDQLDSILYEKNIE